MVSRTVAIAVLGLGLIASTTCRASAGSSVGVQPIEDEDIKLLVAQCHGVVVHGTTCLPLSKQGDAGIWLLGPDGKLVPAQAGWNTTHNGKLVFVPEGQQGKP